MINALNGLKILLLLLDIVKRFTVWMERKEYIAQGAALQVKANLEDSLNVLKAMDEARAKSAADRAAGRVPTHEGRADPDNRDLDAPEPTPVQGDANNQVLSDKGLARDDSTDRG